MAKRFVDTNLFNDEWINELSKDSKLFFVYYILNCDHAGILRLNKKLCEFQTGLKNIDTLIKELGNCLVTVKEGLYFMPKFIKFQYPNFPNSAVKQQESAIKILESLNIDYNSTLTVSELLPKSYVSDNVSVIIKEKKEKKVKFDESEIFDKNKFAEQFKDWSKVKLAYYYEAALRYSNEGNKYIDWIAAVRTWAKKDELQGKIKFDVKPENKNTGSPNYKAFLNGELG